MVLVIMLIATLSPVGDADIQWESFDSMNGTTADMLLDASLTVDANFEIEAGILPEGDYLYDLTWSANGQTVLIANYITKNISVINPSTGEIVSDITTNGLRPGAIAATQDYIVAAFPIDDLAAIYSETGTLLGTVPTEEQPWRIEFSPDGQTAYIGCDVSDCCTVVDLSEQTVVKTIENFPFWLQSFGWGSENPRNYLVFSGFTLTNDGQYIVTANGTDAVVFFNTTTGNIDHTVNILDASSISFSGDGNTLIAMSGSYSSPLTVYQIDLSTFSITESVGITGSNPGTAKQIAVNQDGSKAFISTSGNTSTLINFNTQSFKQFSNTYSAFWTGANYDHTLAISGQYRFSVIDFASETMVAQNQGHSQYIGETSPIANEAVGIDPMRHEGLYYYTFTNSSVSYQGSILSGSPVEGDAPRRVAISPDGNWAVISNTLSGNATVIDLNSLSSIAVLEMGDRVQNVKFTPDSRYAVVCTFESGSIKIIDMLSASVVANVHTGSRAGVVDINPDGTMACVGNISSNTVSFVELDGAASSEIAEKSCGTIGVSWVGYGIQSGVVISPDGTVCLICDSFNDNILVFSMSDYSLLATVPVGDFPLQLAFNNDGSRAMVTCYSDDKVFLLEIDGASSSVLGNWPAGDGPARIAYDQAGDRFGVGVIFSKQIRLYNADNGSFQGAEAYPEAVMQPGFTATGDILALTSSSTSTSARLYRNSEFTELPGFGCTFDFNEATNTAVIAIPGPDMAFAIRYTSAGVETESLAISISNIISVNPNPVSEGNATFRFSLPAQTEGQLSIYDVAGRKATVLHTGSFQAGSNTITCSTPNSLPTGIYSVRFTSPEVSISGRFAVVN